MQSEHLGSYSYHRNPKVKGAKLFIAPEAHKALRDGNIVSRKGKIIV
jgi:hypothetical protein